MERLGVLGWPIRHSRSPAMFRAAFAALGMTDWHYGLLPVPPELFDETVRALPGAGFTGANVTMPHKHAALALADEPTERARAIGAANTLTFAGDRILADNTDAPGLIDALPFSPAGRRALVLGAGGTARAAVWALLDAGAAEVLVWNRTPQRAARLCDELGGRAVTRPEAADLLVQTTSVGHDDEDHFEHLPLERDALGAYACVVDYVYAGGRSALLDAASAAGAAVVDGQELLVRQGARGFERWTGIAPPLDAMRAGVRGAGG
jgi:shikimate dehydrogenase